MARRGTPHMLVLHANFVDGSLRLWGESAERFARSSEAPAPAAEPPPHPYAATEEELRTALPRVLGESDAAANTDSSEPLVLSLPTLDGRPGPSERLAGLVDPGENLDEPMLASWSVPTVALPPAAAMRALPALAASTRGMGVEFSPSVAWLASVVEFVLDLLAEQRFVPTLLRDRGDGFRAAWEPWLHDRRARGHVEMLLAGMPPAVRAADDEHDHHAWPVLSAILRDLTDAAVRGVLVQHDYHEAIEGRDDREDDHVAWLRGLLDGTDRLRVEEEDGAALLRDVRTWINRLDDANTERPYRLVLSLREPTATAMLPSLRPVGEDTRWSLRFGLQDRDRPSLRLDADAIWGHAGARGDGANGAQAQETLLGELGRAARIYKPIEDALEESTPAELTLSTAQAYAFLTQHAPILEESGVAVEAPEWWGDPDRRLHVRLRLDSDPLESLLAGDGQLLNGARGRGLHSLVRYRWLVAAGETALSLEELARLAAFPGGLVPFEGGWLEIEPDEIEAAKKLLRHDAGGEMTVLEALRTAFGVSDGAPGLPVAGIDATGWVGDLIHGGGADWRGFDVDEPDDFQGDLRPYQRRGLKWLAFLDGLGLGACLADDMGLGKTIQMIALLLHERRVREDVGPTLVVAPMSVVSNWNREINRFAPTLRVHVQHGLDRPTGDEFVETVDRHDLVITTYGLMSRDVETLGRVKWHRVVLDEAQFVKNPATKQAQAVRSLDAPRRVALTGTPVENRLTELWSIMDFLNPGYLGSLNDFKRRFVMPIERRRGARAAEALKSLIRPFVLRRLKTDPDVVPDLPQLVESKEHCTLTEEQGRLYETVVARMMTEVERKEGLERRGAIIAGLVKLKQVCNHPANLSDETLASLGVARTDVPGVPQSARSGKTQRLMELLEEVVASGDKALIFTQFRRMGSLLVSMIEHDLDIRTLFLHGGTARAKRQELIDRFQSDDRRAPVFVLSLRAGGIGLNLTAANHVFHFDRWWNPAVENQATDRAFRIGQTRTVQVHKLITDGTLEERIDEMIEQKTELAERIIGSGETWLTELSTDQLRDLLTLRGSLAEPAR